MGAASTDRLIAQSRSQARKSRWPKKFKKRIDALHEEIAETHRNAEQQINAALDREANGVKIRVALEDRIRELESNAPAAAEWAGIKKRWFGARWWWALWRGLRGRMRFELR